MKEHKIGWVYKVIAAIVSCVILASSIISILMFTVFYPSERVYRKTRDYQIIYGIVDTFLSGEKDIFGFGEYKYNSYLLLVPKETPSTLQKFYYRWESGFDVDDYAFYFECKLDSDSYNAYENGLDNFSLSYGGETHNVLKDEEHFDYPTYIMQWKVSNEKWQVLEYIMMDKINNTVIYAFSMAFGYEDLINNASYNIAPNVNLKNVLDTKSFSIYNGKYKVEEMQYDISFLKYLL